jgi:hypothetical protein
MQTFEALTNSRISRRSLFKGAGALGAGLMLARLPLLRSVAADSESVTDIINIAATAEAMAVTLLGGAIDSASKGGYNKTIPAPVVAILNAARAEEEFHYEYLIAAGAKPLTTDFTVPDMKLLTDYDTLFSTIVALEGAFIAAYMAAAREFSAMGQTDLVQVAYEVAGTEAEHRVLANYALGVRPANNVAFEKAMFTQVSDAANALKQLGFIGGTGTKVSYPGPGAIVNTGVSQTTPGGPMVDCTAPTTPPPGGGTTPPPSNMIPTAPVQPKPGATFYDVTGHNLGGGFRAYWEKYGGLAIFGYPLTEEFVWNGTTVQFLERARFEWHPGSWPSHYDVELGLVGNEVAAGRMSEMPFRGTSAMHGGTSWDGKMAPADVDAEAIFFPQTMHNLSGGFRAYWQKFGDLSVFGFPISEEFKEKNPDNGKTYTVQYFERARFEWHPGEWPERWDIELGRLGAEALKMIGG